MEFQLILVFYTHDRQVEELLTHVEHGYEQLKHVRLESSN